jgi:zinc protease
LLVAGKFDEAKTLNLIKQKFGAIPKPDRVLPPNYTVEPTQDGERMVTSQARRRYADVDGWLSHAAGSASRFGSG